MSSAISMAPLIALFLAGLSAPDAQAGRAWNTETKYSHTGGGRASSFMVSNDQQSVSLSASPRTGEDGGVVTLVGELGETSGVLQGGDGHAGYVYSRVARGRAFVNLALKPGHAPRVGVARAVGVDGNRAEVHYFTYAGGQVKAYAMAGHLFVAEAKAWATDDGYAWIHSEATGAGGAVTTAQAGEPPWDLLREYLPEKRVRRETRYVYFVRCGRWYRSAQPVAVETGANGESWEAARDDFMKRFGVSVDDVRKHLGR